MVSIQAGVRKVGEAFAHFTRWLLKRKTLGSVKAGDRTTTHLKPISFLRWLLASEEIPAEQAGKEIPKAPGSFFRNLLEREVLGKNEAAAAGKTCKRGLLNGLFESETLEMTTQTLDEGPEPLPILQYVFQREHLEEATASEKGLLRPSFLHMVFGGEHLGTASDSDSVNERNST